MTPFQLMYGGEAVVSVEIGARVENYDQEDSDQKRRAELDLITETREIAVARLSAYKRFMCQAYKRKVILRSL